MCKKVYDIKKLNDEFAGTCISIFTLTRNLNCSEELTDEQFCELESLRCRLEDMIDLEPIEPHKKTFRGPKNVVIRRLNKDAENCYRSAATKCDFYFINKGFRFDRRMRKFVPYDKYAYKNKKTYKKTF